MRKSILIVSGIFILLFLLSGCIVSITPINPGPYNVTVTNESAFTIQVIVPNTGAIDTLFSAWPYQSRLFTNIPAGSNMNFYYWNGLSYVFFGSRNVYGNYTLAIKTNSGGGVVVSPER